KMSKSYGNTIDIFAEGKPLEKVVKGIVTDSKTVSEPKDPETCNVLALYSLFASDSVKQSLTARYRQGGMGYGEAKRLLLEKIESYFAEARQKRKALQERQDYVEDVLQAGAARARAEAESTMTLVREAVGFLPRILATTKP